MLATAEDVGIFLRTLNDGSVINEGEQEIFFHLRVRTYWSAPRLSEYGKKLQSINTVVIQFNNTTNFDGYDWNLAEIIYNRIVKIVRVKKAHKI